MNSTATFEKQLYRIKKQVVIHTAIHALTTAAGLIACMYAGAAGIDLLMGSKLIHHPWFVKVVVGLPFGFALIGIWMGKKPLLDRFIEIDHRLKLKDTVSTAFEYHRYREKTELSGLLIENAAQTLARTKGRGLFPFKPSWLYVMVAGVILFQVLAVFKEQQSSIIEPVVVSPRTIRAIDTYINKKAKRNETQGDYPARDRRKKVLQDLKKLSDELKRSTVSRRHMAESIGRMLKEIESGQAMVAQELEDRLKLHDIEEIPVQAMEQFQKWSLSNIKQLQKMVDRMFNQQIPGTISERLTLLEEQMQMKELLERLLTEESKASPAERTAESRDRSGRDGRRASRSGSAGDRNPAEDRTAANSNGEAGRSDASENPGGDHGEEEKDKSDDGGASDGEYSSTAGLSKADGTIRPKTDIDSADGAALQDRSGSPSRDYYKVHIRALTAIGRAKLDNQKIIKTYQKEVEAILKKEDIPINYRDYIRNYFLSIGLRKE